MSYYFGVDFLDKYGVPGMPISQTLLHHQNSIKLCLNFFILSSVEHAFGIRGNETDERTVRTATK